MSEFPFQRFIKLIAFDQGIRALEKQRESVITQIHMQEEQLEKIAAELEVAKRHKDAMQRDVNHQEQDMAAIQAKQKEKERLLDRTTHARETQSLYHEIALFKQQQFDLEENLLLAWNKLENSSKEYDVLKKDIDQRVALLQEEIRHQKQQQEAVNQAIAQQQEKRVEYEEDIPTEWLEKYASMRQNVANPVVPVVGNSCSACFYQINAQDLVRLRHNALLQCKDCYRFLYMETV